MIGMRLLLWGSIVLALGACTERNPAYCGDGTCSDPKLPFCDVDGTFSGAPGTCIAVTCTAGEFAHCRGDIAITCSDRGTDYDSVKCPMGCEPAASGCVECTTNAQCGEAAVCDPMTKHCRGCQQDDECDSRVCDQTSGSCVAESSILYASPNGTGTCSLSQPCSLMTAYVTAANATPMPVVRMLPGNYATALHANARTASPVEIVATGANMVVIGDVAAIVVESGASVHIRNLTSTSERQIQCGLASTTAPFSSVALSNASLTNVGAGLGFEAQRCTIDLHDVDLSTTRDILSARDDTTFNADGFYVHGAASDGNALVTAGSRIKIDIINAVFEDTDIVAFANDTGPPGTSLRFAYTTFLLSEGLRVCDIAGTATYRPIRFENSILTAEGGVDTFTAVTQGSNCSFFETLLARQAAPPSGTFVADPEFVSLAARDFHLKAGSPAIDVAGAGTVSTMHDLEGSPRPQGAQADLGAYEAHP